MRICTDFRIFSRSIAILVLVGIVSSFSLPAFAQGRIIRVTRDKSLKAETKVVASEFAESDTEGETTCADGHISFSTDGNSSSNTWGNIRTYSGGNVSVKARAWSRTKDTGAWETAYLGNYGSAGLGVTDRSEDGGDPSHKVDNEGRLNYVVFAFDQPVVVDAVQLESVSGDSDINVWMGTMGTAYTTPVAMSDAVLTGLVGETNTTSSTSSRDADINNGLVVGNFLVVAARTDQANDYFKIANLDKDCASTRVTFVKEVQTTNLVNGSTQSFGFTATGMSPTSFSLVDNNVVGPDRISVAVAAGSTVTATEAVTLGWTLSDLSCAGTAAANITINFGARTASVKPQSGQNVVCTFKNLQLQSSAADVKVSGRATLANERGVGGAIVTIQDLGTGVTKTATTNTFGYYTIEDLEVGSFYMITISHRRHRFPESSKFFTLESDLTDVNFTGGF